MLDPKAFEEFSNRLSALIAASPAADIELNATQAARCTAIKLNVVVSDE